MCDSFFFLYQSSLFSILRGLPLIIPDNRCGSSHHPQAKEATPQAQFASGHVCSSQYNCIETSIQEAWMLHWKLQEKSKLQLLHASSGLWWCGEKSHVKLGIRMETQSQYADYEGFMHFQLWFQLQDIVARVVHVMELLQLNPVVKHTDW